MNKTKENPAPPDNIVRMPVDIDRSFLETPGSSWGSSERERIGKLFMKKGQAIWYQMVGVAERLGCRDPEDWVQEFWVKKLETLVANYDPEIGEFEAMVFHYFVEFVRKRYRGRKITTITDCVEDPTLFQQGDEYEDTAQMAELDVQANVRRALERLTPEMRRLVKRHYFDEIEIEELAKESGKSPGTVRKMIWRAKIILRALGRRYYYQPRDY